MKNSNALLALFFSLAFGTASDVSAQWVQTSGPYGEGITALIASGSNLFAGTYGNGVFLSTDNSASWNAVNGGLSGRALTVNALVEFDSDLFAGTDSGVSRTTNEGLSW